MSEDRPADDQGEGVEDAVELSSDALAELVRLAPSSEAPCCMLTLRRRWQSSTMPSLP